ncbi:MAG: hydroxypyruvate isomerase family protein [Shimia sp.]
MSLRAAANLSWLYLDVREEDRCAQAAEDGFTGVELQFPYHGDVQAFRDRIVTSGLSFVSMNTPPPNYTGGDRGWAARPDCAARFRSDWRRVARYAGVLRPAHIHVMAGEAEGADAEACLVENLAWVCAQAPKQSFTIEPISPVAMPGYFLNDYDQALRILRAVGAPNLGLQFDTYHAHQITGDVDAAWQAFGAEAVHVQFAHRDTRAEPNDHEDFLETLRGCGYTGWVAAEYAPATTTTAGLDWLPSVP